MKLTEKQTDAIFEAIDFIMTNADGADDQEHYANLRATLRSIYNIGRRELKQRKVKLLPLVSVSNSVCGSKSIGVWCNRCECSNECKLWKLTTH